ncbi:MAG: hypothetical protein MJ064_04205 [Lachnospiraceae bacterium]|nr:hypothetical protein [Lachnospiraceae bacterium]
MSEEKKPVRYREPSDAGKVIIPAVVTLVVGLVIFYFALPAINLFSPGFWGFLIVLTGVYLFTAICCSSHDGRFESKDAGRSVRIPFYVIIALIVLYILGGVSSVKLFNAKRYAGLIDVKTAVFEEDMPETTNVNNIALMDTASASIIGNRTLGSLSQVVSQFEIGANYSQINYLNTPKKVANLEYADFFKWMQNRSSGIPGFVMVDPLNNSAEYVQLSKTMKYVDSAYFGKDLRRKLRFSYPTKIFHEIYFEIDEAGNPYYIVSCKSPNAGLFGAMDISEVIIFNPCDGTSSLYDVKDVPSWVDIVYDGNLASDKYNWYGTLSGGFFNSIIGNKNCKRATNDYGYVVLGDDVWYFTGVTSVNKDESNIGFILTNARTGEYKFYPVIGAEEYSAMNAAQGEVQEKGYKASFPSLVNIGGQATYIMVLKDSGGLVKLYALVNVEKYSMVATGTTQQEAMAAYKKVLEKNGIGSGEAPEELPQYKITVSEVRMISVDGVPTVYVSAEDGNVYKGNLNTDESLVLVRVGDKLTVTAEDSDIAGIRLIRTWSR